MKTSTSQLSKKPKRLYRITMNWQGEVHKVYRFSTSVDNALQLAFVHLAKKLGMNKIQRIANYFLSGKDNIEVREVQSEEKDLNK